MKSLQCPIQRCSLLHSVITKYVAALNQICSCFLRDFPFLAGCAFWSFEQDQRIQYAPLLTLHRRADNRKYANNVSQRGCSTVPSGRGGVRSTDRLMLKVYNTYKQRHDQDQGFLCAICQQAEASSNARVNIALAALSSPAKRQRWQIRRATVARLLESGRKGHKSLQKQQQQQH